MTEPIAKRGRVRRVAIFALLLLAATGTTTAAEGRVTKEASPYIILVSPGDDTIEKLFARYPELKGADWRVLASHNLLRAGASVSVPHDMLKGHSKVLAKVSSPYGDVEVKRSFDRHYIPVVDDLLLREGDELRTWRRSGVRVLFEDGNEIVFRGQSKAKLVTLSADARAPSRRIELQSGSIWSEINEHMNGPFEISTPTATTIIRGTTFRVKIEPNDSTRVEVLEGTVEFVSGENTASVTTQEGALTTSDGQAPSAFRLPPAPSSLLSPMSKQVFRAKQFEHSFRWNNVELAAGYHLEVARDEGFYELALERWVTDSQVFVSGLEPGTYFWRASATSAGGFEGAPSEASYFVVVRPN